MTLRWIYGIVPSRAAAVVERAGLAGIDGRAVHTITESDLTAAISEIDEREYGTSELNDRIRDLEWLTPRAAAHQDVNAALLDIAGCVLPLTFGAIYRDDERVRGMLVEDATDRMARLAQLDGRAEWVITITRDATSTAAADDVRELDREIAGSTPGRAFLLEKRRTAVARSASERADADVAARAIGALEAVAERSYREPVAKGGTDVVVARVSLLARRDAAQDIGAAIERMARELGASGYQVRSTGPWPAYRFAALP